MFMHVMRFLLNARESCFKFMVSISVSVESMCEWLAKSSEWQEGAIHCHLSGRELWWMFHVSFTNLCHSIVENQACKIITELKEREKGELIHWPPVGLFILVPPRSLCGHYLQKWLLLTFLYAKNSNYIYLWQPGCCNLRTWTTGCLKNFNRSDLNGNRMEMQIGSVFWVALYKQICLHIMHFDYWMNNIISL